MAELVEEIDARGRVIRVVERSVMRAERLRHRAVFIAVVDSRGRLLVHRRSDLKDVWPGRWDIAAGGVVNVGEAWSDAARRELVEEVGLSVELGSATPLNEVGGGPYEDDDVAVLGRLFVTRSDGPVSFDDGEVVEARFVDRAELGRMLTTVPFCPDSVALVLPVIEPLLGPAGPST